MARKVVVSSPEEKPIEKPKSEVKAEVKAPDAGYDYEKNTKKSFADIARASTEQIPEETPREKPSDESIVIPPQDERTNVDVVPQKTQSPGEQSKNTVSPLDEAKKHVEEQKKIAEQSKKDAEEIAKQTLTEELQKIKDSELSAKEKKEAEKEVRAKWTGVDPRTGTPTPKDYDEIITEARRLSQEDFERLYQARRAKEIAEYQAQQEEARAAQAKQTERQNQLLIFYENRANEELEEMYASGALDRKDEDARQKLFLAAEEFNRARVEKNQAPVDSISRFYHNYYKKGLTPKQAAGADAPIAGNSLTTPKTEAHSNYIRIHNTPFRQLAKGK